MSEAENSKGYWRWYARPFWHHCSSMYQEGYLATHAVHEFERYHHLRACIYFCTATIEAFLNEKMRSHLEKAGMKEDDIFKVLRQTKFWEKIKKWPEKIGSNLTALPPNTLEYIEEMVEIRGEVTHPKNKDHSIFKDLDEINPFWCIKSTTEYIVTIIEGLGEPYPFWLLGWNVVGCNHECQAVEVGSYQFLYGLRCMGLNVPVFDAGRMDVWLKNNMATVEQFRVLKNSLDKIAPNIEPRDPGFPTKPRLTRRWWDKELIRAK